jgi:hypothetical protein
MIFLSKKGEDQYINEMAKGFNTKPTNTEDFRYKDSFDPIVLRGILKKRIMFKCLEDHRDFYYVDTGYFGNEKTAGNPNGWKYWHRIVKNNLQHGKIIDRPDDRFKKFDKKIHSWKKSGRKILIAMPDEKPMKYYNIDKNQWLEDTIKKIKAHTTRPVVVRDRAKLRLHRINSTLEEALSDDVFALVTFNSIAATESIFYGIPAFTLAPCNAASPVSLQDLSQIDNPYYPDQDKVYKWACHLAYGQFHFNEMKDGSWWSILNES